MPSYEDQIVPETAESIEATALALAQANQLPVTSWQTGSTYHTWTKFFSDALARAWFAVTQIARGYVLGRDSTGELLSSGEWLTEVLRSQYDEERTPAVFTIGECVLEDAGGGPHTITAGQVRVATAAGIEFTATSSGTLPLNGTLTVTVTANSPGSAWNVPNETITRLVTAFPTVTVSNPEIGTTGTWITQLGADLESDDAATDRAPLKWSTLSTGSPDDAYKFWALSWPGVTRASVDSRQPDGPNTLRVYVDNAAVIGPLAADLSARAPSGTRVTTLAATTTVIAVPGVVTVASAFRATAQAEVEAAIAALALEVDIGGLVIQSEIVQRIMNGSGVSDFAMGSAWAGSPNIQLAASAMPQFDLGDLEYVETP